MARHFRKITPTDLKAPDLLVLNDNFDQIGSEIDKVEAEIPGTILAQINYATQNLTLTTNFVDVPGAGIDGLAEGTYLVTGVFCMECIGAGDVGQYLAGIVALDGRPFVQTSPLGRAAVLTAQAAGEAATVSQQWLVSVMNNGSRLSLQAAKQGGAGTSACLALDTSIVAHRLGPPSKVV